MKPIDYRNATFHSIRGQLEGMRRAVLEAWVQFGPGTTRGVSEKSGIDILTFRPRTTDLFQLGLVHLLNEDQPGIEGIYAATLQVDWDRWRETQISHQMQLI